MTDMTETGYEFLQDAETKRLSFRRPRVYVPQLCLSQLIG